MNPLNGIVRASSSTATEASSSNSAKPARSFASVMADKDKASTAKATLSGEPSEVSESARSRIESVVTDILDDEKSLDRAMRRASRGTMSNEELLQLQSRMYGYAQKVDLATKVVDKTASSVKQLMQIQV